MSPSLASMAWRNLWRNRRRTLITLSSIAFGIMLAVLSTGIGDANWSQMIDLAARLGGGHVSLQDPEFVESPTLAHPLADASAIARRALADPEVERAVVRIRGQLMLATAGRSYGAGFIAYDPANEDRQTLSILSDLRAGSPIEPGDPRAIVLGAQLAENLRVGVGGKVIVSLTDKQGEIVQEALRVRGLVTTGAPTIDASLVLLPLDAVAEMLRYEEGEALEVGLFLSDHRAAERVAARQRDRLGDRVASRTWSETQPELAGFIAMKVAGAQFMEVVIMLLVAAGIFNTLFVSVMERLREFGIMLAIGFTATSLFALVMLESLWLALLGLVAALLLTAGPYFLLATQGLDVSAQLGDSGGVEVAGVAVSPILHVGILPENLVAILAAAVIATLISGIAPAWHAGRVPPVESIRVG